MFDDVLDNTHFRKSSICSFMLTAASINWCVTHEYTDLVIGQINPTVRRRMAAYRRMVKISDARSFLFSFGAARTAGRSHVGAVYYHEQGLTF